MGIGGPPTGIIDGRITVLNNGNTAIAKDNFLSLVGNGNMPCTGGYGTAGSTLSPVIGLYKTGNSSAVTFYYIDKTTNVMGCVSYEFPTNASNVNDDIEIII